MKTKNTAVFLIIAAIISMIRTLSTLISGLLPGLPDYNWYDYLSILGGLMAPMGMVLLAYAYLNPRFQQARAAAILILIGSSTWIIFTLYYNFLYFSTPIFQFEPLLVVIRYLNLIFPVSMIIFAVSLLNNKPYALKRAAYWLFAGSLVLLFSYSISQLTLYYNFGLKIYDKPWQSVTAALGVISLVYPLAILIFSIRLIRDASVPLLPETAASFTFSDPDTLDNPEPEVQNVPDEVTGYPVVIDWLCDFLLTMIPVVGLVFLIWRGQNKADRTRRNWAIASLFWTAISLLILLLFFYGVVPYFGQISPVGPVILCIIALVLISGFLLTQKMNNDDFDYPFEQPDAPTVGQFFGWMFILSLPVAGFICLIIWATDTQNQVRRQWALAGLIRMGIVVVYYLYLYQIFREIT